MPPLEAAGFEKAIAGALVPLCATLVAFGHLTVGKGPVVSRMKGGQPR